jgi:hypothetical protein
MTITKQVLKLAARRAAARARLAGAKAMDAVLVKAGAAAKTRQRKRAGKTALKTAGKVILAAGAAAATVVAARAIRRNIQRGSSLPD